MMRTIELLDQDRNHIGAVAYDPHDRKLGQRFMTLCTGLTSTLDRIGEIALYPDGTAMNALLDIANTFLTKFDFGNLGEKLGEAINGFFENGEWDLLGETIANGLTAALDFAIGLFKKTNTGAIGQAIGDTLRGLMDTLSAWIQKQDWSDLGNTLWQKIKDLIAGIHFDTLAQSFFTLFGSALGAAVSFVAGFLKGVIDSIAKYFMQFIEDENGDGRFGAGEIINGILKGLLDGVKNIGRWIKENIFQPFIDGFKSAFGIHSPSTVMAEQGRYIVDGLLQGIKNAWKNITSYFSTALSTVKTTFSNAWTSIKDTASSKWDTIKTTVTGKMDELKTTLSTIDWSNIGSNLVSGLKDGISSAWSGLKTTVSTLASGLTSSVKKVFGVASPSKVWAEIGGFLDMGLQQGLESKESAVLATVSKLADKVSGEMQAVDFSLGATAKSLKAIQPLILNVPDIVTGSVVPPRVAIADRPIGATHAVGNLTEMTENDLSNLIREAIADVLEQMGVGNNQVTVKIGEDTLVDRMIAGINSKTRSRGHSVIL